MKNPIDLPFPKRRCPVFPTSWHCSFRPVVPSASGPLLGPGIRGDTPSTRRQRCQYRPQDSQCQVLRSLCHYCACFPSKMMAMRGPESEQGEPPGPGRRKRPPTTATLFFVNDYNAGMPDATTKKKQKTAIDYRWEGFVGKPVMTISHGGSGGERGERAHLGEYCIECNGPSSGRVESAFKVDRAERTRGNPAVAVLEGRLGDGSKEESATTESFKKSTRLSGSWVSK